MSSLSDEERALRHIDNNQDESGENQQTITGVFLAPSYNNPAISESLAKLAASLTEFKLALPSIIPDLSPFLEIQKSLISNIMPIATLTPITDQLAVLQRQVSEMFKGMFEGLGPVLERIDQRYWAILPYLKQAGFVLAPNTPISLLTDLEELINSGCATPENVSKVIVGISEMEDYAVLKDMVNAWKQEAYFSNRSILLDDALEAHINEKYSLSIPAMLPLIEGYFDGCFSEHDKKGLIARMKEHFDSIGDKDEIIADALEAIMEEFLFRTAYFYKVTDKKSYLSFKTSTTMPPDQILNRHGILHGFDHQYVSKENSLRVFFTIDSLVFMMRNREKP